MNALKQSEQSKKNVKLFAEEESMVIFFVPMILPEDKEKEIRERLSKAESQRIEREWSFTNMIASLSKNFYGNSVEFFLALAHGYRNASHVLHGDETGVMIIKK